MTAAPITQPQPQSTTRPRRVNWAEVGPRLKDFFVDAIIQWRIWRRPYAGLMHKLIFFGVTVQIIGNIINLMQVELFIPMISLANFPRGTWYLGFETVMDLGGLALLLGVGMAAFRRLVLRPKTLETRWDDWYALGLLFVLAFLGFTTEGLRIRATNPEWAAWSPVGSWVAWTMSGMPAETAAAVHDYFVWIHMAVGLIFVASIPFTKLRHVIITPLNIVLHPRRKESTVAPIENIEEAETLGVGQVAEFEPWQLMSFDACVRCGRCEELCPATASGMPFSPREFVQSLRANMVQTLGGNGNGNGDAGAKGLIESLGEEAPWYCTTCGACVMNCPAYVNPPAAVIDLRRYVSLTAGAAPKSVAGAMRNLERQGNPWGMPAGDRMAWAADLDLRVLEPGDEVDVLFFTGCAMAFDDRNKKVGRALVALMKDAGIDFGVLGDAEACCGETARKLGYEYNFQVLVEQNVETLKEYKFKRIVTACPHCFNTLAHEYPQFGGDFKVMHTTELLAEAGPRGLSPLQGQSETPTDGQKVAFHDSCYLARYNGVFDAPRDVLDKAGVKRIELERKGLTSFCCGGGGGQMWMETDPNTRINQRRLAEAVDAGADVVATACPYCLIMFDDAIRTTGRGEQVKVLDIAEILAEKLETR